jgi:hypothetical protein
MPMTRPTLRILAWTWACTALLAAVVLQTNAALVLCVARDHVAVERVHGEGPCAEGRDHAHSLGAPERDCTDTVLCPSSSAAAPERVVLAPPAVVAVGAAATPPEAASAARYVHSPREPDRARSTTVLLI